MGNKDNKRWDKLNYKKDRPARENEEIKPSEKVPDEPEGVADKTSPVNESEKFRVDINFLKSAVTSLSTASSKLATKEDIQSLMSFFENTSDELAKLRNSETRIVGAIKAGNLSAEQSFSGKFINLPRRDDLNSSENRIKAAVEKNSSSLRSAVVDESGQTVIKAVNKISKSQRNSNEELSKRLDELESKLKDISNNTEVIQSLRGTMDEISQVLTNKGLQLKQDFPVVNHDEETLADLAECGEKILQQLAIAARWYARKLPELNAHETAIKNLNEANEKAVNRAREEGEVYGRKAVIKELLGLYDDLHKLMNPSADDALNQLNVLADFLRNKGVEPIYQLNAELEITDADVIKYQHNIANLQPGKIVITSPGYAFDTETIEKAKYIPAEEFYSAQETSPAENSHDGQTIVIPDNQEVDDVHAEDFHSDIQPPIIETQETEIPAAENFHDGQTIVIPAAQEAPPAEEVETVKAEG